MMEQQDRYTIKDMKELLKDGLSFSLVVTGVSMRPFLEQKKDAVTISPVSSDIKRGDILFYERGDSIVRLHRVQKVKKDVLYLVGDAQVQLEPVDRSQVLGIATELLKADGRVIPVTSGKYRLKVFFWQLFRPLRPYIFKLFIKNR